MFSKSNYIKTIGLCITILSLFVLDIVFGSVVIPFNILFNSLFSSEETIYQVILMQFRLPKAFSAVFVGAGLSVAGLLLQSLFRNPLAGPYVLGISSGASLGVATFILSGGFAFLHFELFGNLSIALAAIIGALLVTLLILSFATKVRDSVSLLLIGVMFGSLTTAIVSIFQYFSRPELLQNFIVWTFGSLSGIVWNQLFIFAPIVIVGLFFSFLLSKPMNALLLNEKYAESAGVDVKRIRVYIILITSIVVGVLTAFAGPIAFVGLAVPHIARFFYKTSDHRILIPASVCIGIALMLLSDFLSQLPLLSNPLPINSITSLFGAPIVIFVILQNKMKKGGRV